MLVVLAACSSRPGYTSYTPQSDQPQVEDPAYREARDRFTRWRTSYDELDARVFCAATWQSWPMRRARVKAISEFRRLSPGQAAEFLAREMTEARSYNDIFLGIYTAESRWNDLSSPRSIWHVTLESVPGGTVEPIAMERVERPDANLRALYPYLSPFWVGYRLRFPPPPPGVQPTAYVLRLDSAVAQVTSTWETAGVEPPPPPEESPAAPAPAVPAAEPAPTP